MLSITIGRKAAMQAADDVRTAIVLANHIEQCKTDKQRIEDALKAQDLERKEMHAENQRRFRRVEAIYYFGTAALAILIFFGTDFGQRLLTTASHGMAAANVLP